MTEETLSDKKIKLNIKCPYCKKEIWLGERVVHGEHRPFHFDCFIQKLKDEFRVYKEFTPKEIFYEIDKLAGDALIHNPQPDTMECSSTEAEDTPDDEPKNSVDLQSSGTHGSGNASYAKKVIASGRKITTEPEPIHYPKRTTDNASCPNPKENDHFCKHGTHITKIMGCIKCVEEKRGSDNKGCGKIEEEVFEGKVIETYVCGTRASEFNAVYLCDKCRTTDNKGCTNPEADRVYNMYLKERESFEKRLKKEKKKAYEKLQETVIFYEDYIKKLKSSGNQDCKNPTIKKPRFRGLPDTTTVNLQKINHLFDQGLEAKGSKDLILKILRKEINKLSSDIKSYTKGSGSGDGCQRGHLGSSPSAPSSDNEGDSTK